MRTPGVRQDHRTGQFVPTVDGKDESPTSFDEARALDIASQICRMENNARPGDVASLVFERDALREALSDAVQWMRGRSPEVDAVADRYQALIDGTNKPWHGPDLTGELLRSLKAMCGAYAGTGEQSSASESLNAYEQALQIIAKVESR